MTARRWPSTNSAQRKARTCESCHNKPKAMGYGISGGVFQTRYPEDMVEDLIDQKNGQVIPGQYKIQIQIALQHKQEGRPEEALSTLALAITGNPDNPRLYAVRGSILLEQGRIAPALADLEKSVKLNPEDAVTLTNRAQAYRQFGRVDRAVVDLDRAVELKPDLIAARFNGGALRYGKQDFKGALEDFDHFIAVDTHLLGPGPESHVPAHVSIHGHAALGRPPQPDPGVP